MGGSISAGFFPLVLINIFDVQRHEWNNKNLDCRVFYLSRFSSFVVLEQ